MYCSSVITCSQLWRTKVFQFYSTISQLSKNRVRPLLCSAFQLDLSVAMVWSVESLPSTLAARVRFLAGSGILIPILGLGVCPVLSLAEALTLCWPHIQGGPPLCICLVLWSIVSCSTYRYLSHGHLGCKSLECKSYIGKGKWQIKKQRNNWKVERTSGLTLFLDSWHIVL